jgi:predicted lipoprotein with Yx(FWY)xxD motif
MHHRFTATAALLALASAALGQAIHVPSLAITGAAAGDQFGASVRAAGDVNNDGFDDFVVGSRFDGNTASNTGSARVFSGADGAILFIFDGDAADDYFAISVSGAGDVNNDGFDDFIVGAPDDDNTAIGAGSARVFSGVDGSILYTFDGDSAGDSLGFSVSGAGDVNNDGFDDLIVGAHFDDNNGAESGSARVFSGADGAILYTFNGDSAGDALGISVSGAGDVNNDGFDDLIVGASGDDNNGDGSGSARVFFSVPLPAAPAPCPGDLNGDKIVNFADLNGVLSNFGAPCPD